MLIAETRLPGMDVLDAVALYHELRRERDAGATLSAYEEEMLHVVRDLLEPVRVAATGARRELLRLATNRQATIAADGRLVRGRVVELTLHTLDVVTAEPLPHGDRVALSVDGEGPARRRFFSGRVVRRAPAARATVAFVPARVLDRGE